MRDFQKLDPQSLKAFYYAADTLNFTRAAEAAALTQSGVSQHVARLEQELGVDLFIRSGRKVLLTESGKRLKSFAESYLDQVDHLIEGLRKQGQVLKGVVRYAMPNSCLFTPHFSMLLKARMEFGGVDLRVRICHSEEVLELLLKDEVDFGFVTKKINHTDLSFEHFASENYVLVSSRKEDLKIENLAQVRERDFVDFPGMEVLFDHWQSKRFPRSKKLVLNQLKIRGKINDLSGAITLVTHGVGMTVLPRHCVEDQIASKQLYALNSQGCENPIYIVEWTHQKRSARVQKVLDTFWGMSPIKVPLERQNNLK